MKHYTYTLLSLLAILLLGACQSSKDSHKLNSKDYNDREERVNVLKQEIIWSSNFSDAEFDLFNVNGFSNGREFVPGASSWNYKFVVKVLPQDVYKWIKDCKKVKENGQLQWTKELIKLRKQNWTTTSSPKFYESETAGYIVYKTDGIIFKIVVNL